MIYIYRHDDSDGLLAFLAAKFFIRDASKIVEYVASYNKDLEIPELTSDDEVMILDFSFPAETMQYFVDSGARITWIDHHKTAIAGLSDFSQLPGLRMSDIRYSAAKLTYIYFNNKWNNTLKYPEDVGSSICDEDCPKVIDLVSDWDTWAHIMGGDETYYHFRVEDAYDGSATLTELEENVEEDIKFGKLIYDYLAKQSARAVKKNAFFKTVNGFTAICLNDVPIHSSMVFDSFFEENGEADMGIIFTFDGNTYKVSLYSFNDNLDVSEIALKFGGGGHKGASGCTVSDIFELFDDTTPEEGTPVDVESITDSILNGTSVREAIR